MPTDNPLLEAALTYARLYGWPVFPLGPGGKRPLPGSHGFKDATTDPEAIRRAWAGAARNIGLPPGRAGLVVLDLDIKHGADGIGAWEALAAELGCDVHTLASRTPSGGRHLFFRCPPGVAIRSSQGRVRPGIDVRSRGGYVVLPPSRIRDGPGWQAYAWDPAGPEAQLIAPLPEPLADLLQALQARRGPLPGRDLGPPPHPGQAGGRNGQPLAAAQDLLAVQLAALAQAPPGTRNDQLNRSAFALGQLVASGTLDLVTVKTALAAEARRTGLGEREIRATIRSGLEAGLQKPRPERVFSAGAQSRPADKSPVAASPEAGAGRAPPGNGLPQARGTAAAAPHLGRRYPLTDYGNAERLAARHGQDLRYCHAWGQWLVWDGRRWRQDDTGEVERRAKGTVRQIYVEAAGVPDGDLKQSIIKWGKTSESRPRLQALIELARSEAGIAVPVEDLDADPWLLTVANGTLDLRTGELRPHDRADGITKLAPVAYDPQAQAPTWEAFLDRILNGVPALIAFLQRAVGYALTGDTREQVLFLLYGTGANGKTTLLETLSALLGDYAQRTPTQTLLVKVQAGVPNDLARLRGARLVTAVEAEEGERLAESLVKQMTGGDRLAARFLHREWFEFVPEFKLFLATNHKPVIRGTDRAIWRRIRMVPFRVTIPEAEQDRTLGETLQAEGPGILAWAVRGCLAWQREGLGAPPDVRQATAGYRREMDVLGGFVADCCVVRAGAQVTVKALYEAYGHWCQANGEPPLSKIGFGSRLRERGLEQIRGAQGLRSWEGVGLLDDVEQPEAQGETFAL